MKTKYVKPDANLPKKEENTKEEIPNTVDIKLRQKINTILNDKGYITIDDIRPMVRTRKLAKKIIELAKKENLIKPYNERYNELYAPKEIEEIIENPKSEPINK